MQEVISLDDNIYKRAMVYKGEQFPDNDDLLGALITAVTNGAPLQKGHGKLIAEPTEEDIAKTVGGQNDFAECIRDAVKAVFDNAPTIIGADKVEE